MKKSMMAMTLGLALGLGLSAETRAEERTWDWSPVGIGLAAPIQVPFVQSDVYGLRLGGFFGYERNVYGLDCGLAEVCSGDFAGLQLAAFSWTESNVYGVQCSALANVAGGQMKALQVGCVNTVWGDVVGGQLGLVNYTTDFCGAQFGGVINWNVLASSGLQVGLVNANQGEFTGWAFGGVVNYADIFRGFGCGLVNVAYEVTGFQLGLVNACDRMHGVQFGLLNLICNSKLPIMVVANAAF
ncbi:MAG: hypothetical protein ACI4RD_09320 [Kiritimatiellia bacterium]